MHFYQHLPEFFDPIAFSIGSFNFRWYSLSYLMAFCVVYALLSHNGKNYILQSKISKFKIKNTLLVDFILHSFVGLIVGARLGYVLFYNLSYFIQNPLVIISPVDSGGNFVGIFGMSFYGGLIGIIFTSIIFCKKNNLNFWNWADFVVPAIPAGYFFGRIGNFLNGELYGKTTDSALGMYFSGVLRYPTQLLEAFFEGIVVFIILWSTKNKSKLPGFNLLLYLFSYNFFRFFAEFLREQDQNLILNLSRSQLLSLGVISITIIIYIYRRNKSCYNEANGWNKQQKISF